MATWLSGISKQHRIIRHNTFLWCGVFVVLFGLVLCRLLWLETVRGRFFHALANEYHYRETVLPADRGRLLDRNLAVLALDDQRRTLFADPTLVGYPEFIARQLAPVIDQPDADVLEALTHQLDFIWITHDLTPEAAAQVRTLPLPALTISQGATRYRIGINLAQAAQDTNIAKRLAEALHVSATKIQKELTTPGHFRFRRTAADAIRWLSGSFSEEDKRALEKARLAAVQVESVGQRFSLGVDPRVYNSENPVVTSTQAANALAPYLKMPAADIEGRLLYRPRFSILKRDLTRAMDQKILQLQGTLFVAAPGKLLEGEDSQKALQSAVDRLDSMLNDKKGPKRISREEIEAHLKPGAEPGPLAIKLRRDGQPDKMLARRLLTVPIPGVFYGLPGIAVQSERRRHYPYNMMAAQTIGFVGYVKQHKQGVFGLEETQDEILRGIDGRLVKEIDARNMDIPDQVHERIEPKNGRDVVLTLDLNIQQTVETELAKVVEASKAVRGECIVLDVTTGDILAFCSLPSWNANTPGKGGLPLVNPIVSNYYEPGSTFKTITALIALEEGIAKPGQQIVYCSGGLPVGNKVVHEAHNAHGQVDMKKFLEQSCNICGATLAMRVGPEQFLKWCEKLGFGAPVGLEVGQESAGSLNRRNARQAKITLANMGFGQSLAVTVTQLASAYATVANGGEWIQPHLVKGHYRPDGILEEVTPIRRRVCSEENAKLIRDYLENAVAKGTGDRAKIPGYRVGGKTGTAQKPGKGGFRSGKYIASFAGIMPMDKPRLAILAVIDEPRAGSIYGGAVAAPIVSAVGMHALQYLSIPPNTRLEHPAPPPPPAPRAGTAHR
ncbi:MAG: peptidoglycan D,D-transpeptidase FtsI family protein [Armatimonadota bacterium]